MEAIKDKHEKKENMWRIECKKQKYKSRMNELFSNQRDLEG